QWGLAGSPQTTAKDRTAWRDKAMANVRELANSGRQPVPPTLQLASIAFDGDDPILALGLVETALRQQPSDVDALIWKLRLEIRLNMQERAEATARALAAIPDVKDDQRRARWNRLSDLASLYWSAGRRTDAQRWSDVVHEQILAADPDQA